MLTPSFMAHVAWMTCISHISSRDPRMYTLPQAGHRAASGKPEQSKGKVVESFWLHNTKSNSFKPKP